MLCYSFRFKNNKSVECTVIGVKLEVLSFPYKALAELADGPAIGVCLLEQRLIEGVFYLTLGFNLLAGTSPLLGIMDVDDFTAFP